MERSLRGWEGTADSSMIDLAAICLILGAIPNNSTTSNPNQAVIDFAELSVSFRSITIILGVRLRHVESVLRTTFGTIWPPSFSCVHRAGAGGASHRHIEGVDATRSASND